MSSHTITIIIAVVYFVVILVIGYLAGLRTKGMKDYMIGGQSLGVWITSLGIMAAVMSGWTWLGNPGYTYTYGYSGHVRMNGIACLGLVLCYFAIAKPVRVISEKHGCLSLPDILATRFNNNKTIHILTCAIILIGCFTYLVSQWSSMGVVMEYILGIDYKWGLVIGAIIITAYVMFGGMLASMWTNFFQMILMFVFAIVLMFVCFKACGGLTNMNEMAAAIDPGMVTPTWSENGMSFIYIFSYQFLLVALGYGGQPGINTKFMMVNSRKELKWSPLISVVALVIGCSTFFAGIAGADLVAAGAFDAPAKNDQILLSLIDYLFTPGLGACILVAVMAAVMSTAETYLFQAATTMTQDLAVKVFGIKWDDKKTLRISRIVMICVTIVTVILALDPPDLIANLGTQAFGSFCGGFGAVMYIGMRWRRVNSKAAIAGLVTGLCLSGIFPLINTVFFNNALLPGFTAAGLGVVASAVVIILVTLCTKREDSIVFSHFTN